MSFEIRGALDWLRGAFGGDLKSTMFYLAWNVFWRAMGSLPLRDVVSLRLLGERLRLAAWVFVARAEAKSRRMMVEADRRKAEEARMATQHDAIGRRPGGKKVLLAAQRELLSQSNGRRPGSQSPKGRRSPIPTNAL